VDHVVSLDDARRKDNVWHESVSLEISLWAEDGLAGTMKNTARICKVEQQGAR
jgi:hypothetical protein